MIRFIDGPAAGQALSLARAPLLLRVVCSAKGDWDALDQLGDTPKPGETIHVYRRESHKGSYFWDGRGKGGRRTGGFSQIATYRHLPDQPGDQHTRDTAAWRSWCEANKELLVGSQEGGAV